jgi:hypothetical protein
VRKEEEGMLCAERFIFQRKGTLRLAQRYAEVNMRRGKKETFVLSLKFSPIER